MAPGRYFPKVCHIDFEFNAGCGLMCQVEVAQQRYRSGYTNIIDGKIYYWYAFKHEPLRPVSSGPSRWIQVYQAMGESS